MQKVGDGKIKIIRGSGQIVTGALASKKKSVLFGLFAFSGAGTRPKSTQAVLREPLVKSSSPITPQSDLAAVKNWVALEEKIVHDYKEQKAAVIKSAVPLPKNSAKSPSPVFENFTTRTAAPLSPVAPKHQKSSRVASKFFPGVTIFFLVCGWIAAGTLVFLYAQGTFSIRETSQKLLQLQSEKDQLGRSYAESRSTARERNAEIKLLTRRLRDLSLELKAIKEDKTALEQGLENNYREELMKITVRYEAEISRLRGVLHTQESIIRALKAQGQAFDKIVDQVGMSALSGAAAGFSQGTSSSNEAFVPQGEITSINRRQGTVVINLGSDQGAVSRRWIKISRAGIGLAVGRIDRVYPTMSVAMIRDPRILPVLEEGDSVSLA